MSGATNSPGFARRAIFFVPLAVVLAGIVFFVSGPTGLLSGRDPAALPSALLGRAAPDTTLPALDGLRSDSGPIPGFSRADLSGGGVTVVNVFASWCAPCRDEHPTLMKLKESGVRIVGLNYKDDPENARRFLGGLGLPYERVGADPSGRAGVEWGVYGVPETFVITGDGRIAYKFVGPLSDDTAETVLKPQIEKARAQAQPSSRP
jgi:cytochrome c biogenesis protein CcmG/thiol:disulfide interchange protein DsbE